MKRTSINPRSLVTGLLTKVAPKHYVTPTPDYAGQKFLKDVTSQSFFLLDRIGVHVMPKHFYTTVSDYSWLRANRAAWDGPNELRGIEWDLEAQLAWLQEHCAPTLSETIGLQRYNRLELSHYGPGFGPIESQVLHGFIRSVKPPRVIEVGSGCSTAVMIEAAELNAAEGHPAIDFTAIDPYPLETTRALPNVKVVPSFVQTASLTEFDRLEAGDLLFIDSSHAVKIGSDVVHLFLSVIPRLKPGVYIHIHDINLPYAYSRTSFVDYFGWQETALIIALMTNNSKLKPLASLSAMHYGKTKEFGQLFPDYRPQENDAGLRSGDWVGKHFPDSLWLRTV
jgi:Methyltransferase domain